MPPIAPPAVPTQRPRPAHTETNNRSRRITAPSRSGRVEREPVPILTPLMPKQKNMLLRTLVPLLIIVVGAGLAFMAFRGNSGASPAPQPTPAPAPPSTAQPAANQPPVAATTPGATDPTKPSPAPAPRSLRFASTAFNGRPPAPRRR